MNAMIDLLWARLSVSAADAMCELAITGSLFGAVLVVAGPMLSGLMRRVRAPRSETLVPRYLMVD